MFCLFRNAILPKKINILGVFISFLAAGYWLYFSLIENNLLKNLFEGKALFIDLLFALPLTLFFSVVIYAFSLWMYRFVFVLIFNHILQLDYSHEQVNDDISEQEKNLGKGYWKKHSELEDSNKE